MKLETNTIYRYASPYNEAEEIIDGLPNYFYKTYTKGKNKPLIDSGINPIGDKMSDGRIPAILIHSNPIKYGTEDTPWMDILDPDNGFVRYSGDNKPGCNNPDTPGNISLIKQFELHQSNKESIRKISSPIIIFKNIQVKGKRKGFKKFLGFGIIRSVERVTEYHRESQSYFPNYVFDIMILDMINEGDTFDWNWISARRTNSMTLQETLSFAPSSWKLWVKRGNQSLSSLKRKVYKPFIVQTSEQQNLDKKSKIVLKKVYDYYLDKKIEFECLAAFVTEKIILSSGSNYTFGWITEKSRDGGVDFVGKIKIGQNILSPVNIVVLGQAKCIKWDKSVSGVDLARTVARLKRGWIGIFVTTGCFSVPVQKEAHNDKFPLMLVNGASIAEILIKYMHDEKYDSVTKLLIKIKDSYSNKVLSRRPDEILFS